MKSNSPRTSRRNRGSVTIFFTVGMVALIGMVGLTLDFGHVAVRKTQLQNFVDAKATAALKEQFGSPSRPISAEDYLGSLGASISAAIGSGAWDFAPPAAFTTSPPTFLPASMVPARSASVDTLDVPLFFGPLFGIHSATIHADAVAFAPKRDVVIVQDVSGSMNGTPINQARNADQTLVNQMLSQNMPGDRVGVVAFNNAISGTLNLTPLAGGGAATVNAFIGGLTTGGTTDIGAGIAAGTALFAGPDVPEVERLMIVVGDGSNCCSDVGTMNNNTRAAADAAASQGIDVYTIYFAGSSSSTADFLASLRRGRGTFNPAPTGTELTQLLIDIVTGVPMRLVQ